MNGRQRFLKAVRGECSDGPSVGTVTSLANVEAMEQCGAAFPDVHLDAHGMAKLAAFVSVETGFDAMPPVFSVAHEAAALGADVDWGKRDQMPWIKEPLWREPHDICVRDDFEAHPAMAAILEALRMLKDRYGTDHAIIGKAFGPWSLSYHMFGIEKVLTMTMDDPDKLKRILRKLSEVSLRSALAQVTAGADVLCLGDHCSADMCSPDAYLQFLYPLHQLIAREVPCPVVLHMCGDTSDRIQFFAQTGFSCFHYDTRVPAVKAVELAGGRISLMGGVSNVESLLAADQGRILSDVKGAIDAGTNIVGPECAIPLGTKMRDLAHVRHAVAHALSDNSLGPT